jgi:anti-sigma factor ChrR (cupin superfamily)
MKKLTLASLVCLVAAAAFAQDAAKSMEKAPMKKGAAHMGMKPKALMPSDMKWADMAGAPGVKIADLWGNHEKGAFGAIIKFPAGFMAPLHTHTNSAHIVVISGTFLQTPEGGQEMRLGPGSYLMQPGDGYKHTTGCDPASECVFFVEMKGKFDLLPVEAAKK